MIFTFNNYFWLHRMMSNITNYFMNCPYLNYISNVNSEKGGKFRNVNCRTWNMARKLKIMENEKHPLDDLKNEEITEKSEK